jgi:hypothetical protein
MTTSGARFWGPSSAPCATLRGLQPSPKSESLPPINDVTIIQTKPSETHPSLT